MFSKNSENQYSFYKKWIIFSRSASGFYWDGEAWTQKMEQAKRYANRGSALRAANQLHDSDIKQIEI